MILALLHLLPRVKHTHLVLRRNSQILPVLVVRHLRQIWGLPRANQKLIPILGYLLGRQNHPVTTQEVFT